MLDRDMQERIVLNSDISHHAQIVKQEFLNVTFEMQRPFILLKPKLYKDGNSWCCLYGDNIQEGVVGFGDTPDKASIDFDEAFYGKRPTTKAIGGE